MTIFNDSAFLERTLRGRFREKNWKNSSLIHTPYRDRHGMPKCHAITPTLPKKGKRENQLVWFHEKGLINL